MCSFQLKNMQLSLCKSTKRKAVLSHCQKPAMLQGLSCGGLAWAFLGTRLKYDGPQCVLESLLKYRATSDDTLALCSVLLFFGGKEYTVNALCALFWDGADSFLLTVSLRLPYKVLGTWNEILWSQVRSNSMLTVYNCVHRDTETYLHCYFPGEKVHAQKSNIISFLCWCLLDCVHSVALLS